MTLAFIAMLSVLASCGGDDSQKPAEDAMKQAQEAAMENMTPEEKAQAEAAMKAVEAMKAAQ